MVHRFVRMPTTEADIRSCMHEYDLAGFTGCIGSADATHIVMDMCAENLKVLNTGGKSSHPTRAFNIVVNHRRRILHTTPGAPGKWNDKTLVTFDHFVSGVQDGILYSDIEYDLEELRGSEVRIRRYKGVWIMVDNGYLAWPTTVPPIKIPADFYELRWSKWLESLRKDVECTFGILKGRYAFTSCLQVHLLSCTASELIGCLHPIGGAFLKQEFACMAYLSSTIFGRLAVLFTTCFSRSTDSTKPGTVAPKEIGNQITASMIAKMPPVSASLVISTPPYVAVVVLSTLGRALPNKPPSLFAT